MVSPPCRQFSLLDVDTRHDETVLQSWMPADCWLCLHCEAVNYVWEVPDKGPGCETATDGARVFVRPSFANFACIELARQQTAALERVQYSGHILVPGGTEHYHMYESQLAGLHCHLPSKRESSLSIEEAQLSETQREVLEHIFKTHRLSRREVKVMPALPVDDYEVPEDFLTMDKVAGEKQRIDYRKQAVAMQYISADCRFPVMFPLSKLPERQSLLPLTPGQSKHPGVKPGSNA